MTTRKPLLIALLFATLGATALPALARGDVDIYFGVAPPPPRYEVLPAPRAGWVWIPGYWDAYGHRHVWRAGHWERARHGHYWREPRWEQRGDRWYFERGGWRRDSDRDGVPDRYDRAPYNPYRR